MQFQKFDYFSFYGTKKRKKQRENPAAFCYYYLIEASIFLPSSIIISATPALKLEILAS